MKRSRFWSSGGLPSLTALLLVSATAPAAERLGVEDVLQLAMGSHPSVQAARAQARAAEERHSGARGRLLPVVSVHDEYQHWDSPFEIAFGDPGTPPVRARDQDTNTFTAAVSQPLLGLLGRVQDHAAQGSAAEARAAQTEVVEESLREQLQIEYLRLFEARAMQQVAQASQSELAQQVTNTQVKVQAGTLTNADLLRVQVALTNARQQEIVAVTAQTVSRARLLSAIGRSPDDAGVEFAEPTQLLEQSQHGLPKAVAAPEARPEVVRAEREAQAAHHEERSRFFALLPEVDLNAAYSRTDGQVFAPPNAAFIGVKADWPVWEWGSTASAHAAAREEEAAALSQVENERRQALTDMSVRRAELTSADSAVGLAKEGVASATEAFRVTEAVVRVGSGTTTDLLDSQSALTQARLHLARAEYERAIAFVQLQRAMGLHATR